MNLTLDSSIFVMLAPKDVVYYGEVDLAQYYVKNTTMDENDDFVIVKVTLGRRILSNLLTVYVPTLLLNIIALSTNYFKVLLTLHIYIASKSLDSQDFFFEAVVTVNMSALLVLATMFIGSEEVGLTKIRS